MFIYLSKYIFYNMINHMFYPWPSQQHSEDNNMLKLVESILVVKPRAMDVIEREDMICDFMILLCIMNTWELIRLGTFIFGMGEVHNAFRLTLYEFDIYNDQRLYEGR